MVIEILGSGTSMGVPVVGCECGVCQSNDSRDKRLRTSAFVRIRDVSILIDTSVDYRQQMLRAGKKWIDAVLYTHHHVDHILGMDDLRSLNLLFHYKIPIYAHSETMENIKRVFSYVFADEEVPSDIPQIEAHVIDEDPFEVMGVQITPIPLWHGKMKVFGYRIGDFAYCTDVNNIPESSYERLKDLKILVLGALRFRPHPTHFSIAEAIEEAIKIGAEQTYFIHMTHEVPYEETERQLPPNIHLAYDGLKLFI